MSLVTLCRLHTNAQARRGFASVTPGRSGLGRTDDMRKPFRGAIATCAMVTALFLPAIPVSGQTANKPPRMPDGKPNLNGIWQAMNTANWDLQEHAARPGLVLAASSPNASRLPSHGVRWCSRIAVG